MLKLSNPQWRKVVDRHKLSHEQSESTIYFSMSKSRLILFWWTKSIQHCVCDYRFWVYIFYEYLYSDLIIHYDKFAIFSNTLDVIWFYPIHQCVLALYTQHFHPSPVKTIHRNITFVRFEHPTFAIHTRTDVLKLDQLSRLLEAM